MDNITSDLVYYGSDSSLDFYGKIDESGKISWKTSSFSSEGHDVRLTWKSSSDPEYIDVSNSRNFSLKKRPELAKGEEDKAVTIKVEAYDCETYQTKNVDLNLIIKAGDYIKTPYDYVEENIFDLIKGENLDKSNIKTDLVDYNGSAKEGKAKKGSIRISWKKTAGYKVDGYEVFRSNIKNRGFGKSAYYKTEKNNYRNTKAVSKGKTYYYKIRGYRIIDGKKVYTKWSNKAYRTAI